MLEILQSESGLPTARLDGRYLHSPRDPVKEADRTIEKVARREPPCIVLLGFGLGYVAGALLENTESTTIVVLEPDPKLDRELAAARHTDQIRMDPRLHWCASATELRDGLASWAQGGFEVISLAARRQASPLIFDEADAVLAAFRNRLDINANTLRRFGRLWVKNLSRNLDSLLDGHPVRTLTNKFRGLPALILAGGPGLDQVLPVLSTIRDRALVIAVDTAVGAALAQGVEPDFAVVVDPQYWNARHLDTVSPGRTILVAESSTYPAVFRHFRTPAIFCRSLFPLGQEIESVLEPLGSLGTGGSVSTTAWDLARVFGCPVIYTAGLDLGFPAGRTHFRGSFFESLAVALGHRLRPAESVVERYVRSGDPFLASSTTGDPVLTDRRMELYTNWFARQFATKGAPVTHTLSTGGVAIEGMSVTELESVLALPAVRKNVDAAIDQVFAPRSPRAQDHRQSAVLAQLREITDNLSVLRDLGSAALDELNQVKPNGNPTAGPDFAKLTEIDRKIESVGATGVASFLMQEAIASIRAGYGSADLDEQIAASRELYGSLVDSTEFHLECLASVAQVNG